ncbi:MAG: hypothetical protein PHR77_13155 [Kiritimatiellae bacterium]|nr:hypothetical protein [Kiritimatiellia bacterium]MDD5520175.1 hypothetical protein [Kiritimatiellia bacterium]
MKNVFILYMPPGNSEAMVHYEDTIRKRVEPQRIFKYTDSKTTRKLQSFFGNRPIAVWGSRDSSANRTKFDRMNEGDHILIVEGKVIKLLGNVACKTVSPDLSRELWQNIRGGTSEGWDLIYFIANAKEIDLPFDRFCQLFGYKEEYQLRGFTNVADDRLQEFYGKYDDLYSVLLRIKGGQPIVKKQEVVEAEVVPELPLLPEELSPDLLSDHVKMQWKLLSMGKKAGEKVWVPKNDQLKITKNFQFNEFEEEFTAGLDTQAKYVENIDVVWKEEFRIDAAFEIENSTSIYSGLLRFADLTMVAPNTLYPMFIVAPSSRRERVKEQLNRPTFKRLHISDKVHYLSYEAVDEIEEFFGETGKGLNADVIMNKAEKLAV